MHKKINKDLYHKIVKYAIIALAVCLLGGAVMLIVDFVIYLIEALKYIIGAILVIALAGFLLGLSNKDE